MFKLGDLKIFIYVVRLSSHRRHNIFPFFPPSTPSLYEHSSSQSWSSQNKFSGAFPVLSRTPPVPQIMGNKESSNAALVQTEREGPSLWLGQQFRIFKSTTDFLVKVSNKSIVHGTPRADPFLCTSFWENTALRRILSPSGRFQDENGQLWMVLWAA